MPSIAMPVFNAKVSRRLIAAFCTLLMASGASAEGVEWTVAPYLWAADVGVDLTINDDPALGTTVPFKDLVDKLDGAFMAHAEVRSGRFGGLFDMIYIDLGDSSTTAVGPGGPILGDLVTDTRLKLQLYELAGFVRIGQPDATRPKIDVLLGVRRTDLDLSVDITLPGPGGNTIFRRVDVSETDIFSGVRVVGRFSERWGYRVRADYGTGGTEGTVNLLATAGYSFGQNGRFGIDVGYRYLNSEFENASASSLGTETDITMSGPVLGFVFNF
jgi:hypothetical protein